jgi:drug/metabolite transporter (DMT)-like permease
MTDPNSPNPTGTPPGGDWRAQRHAERDARRAERRQAMGPIGNWPVGGLVIIAIGVIFLLGNFGMQLPARWWAVLLLVPAAGMLVAAARFYRADNNLGGRAIGPLIGGLVMLALALAVFFGLNWGQFWPLVLIVLGVAIVFRRGMRR